MKRPAGLLGPLPNGLSLSALPAQSAMNDPGCGEVQIVLRSNAVVYQLPHTFIRSGSDSLWTRDTPWRRGADYVLDGLRESSGCCVIRCPATLFISRPSGFLLRHP